jgi:hypothetical protein
MPAVAVFMTRDGRRFLMTIAGMDEQNRLQLKAIEGQPWMRSEDLEDLASITYLDELGRTYEHMARRHEQALG